MPERMSRERAAGSSFTVSELVRFECRVGAIKRGDASLLALHLRDGVPVVNGSKADLPYLKNTAGQAVAANPGFLRATAYQLPLAARLGARLSF